MAGGTIYLVEGDDLRRMAPSAPESEDRMQELVARYPELIAGDDGPLLLIRREQAIGDGTADGRWSLDHLFVTRDAVPVLVEIKRASDTRIRREVVGQLIDYAANASAHWAAGTVAASFARGVGVKQADALLAEFLGGGDPEPFWAQVDSNLTAGRIKLVFVADQVPRELAVVVEFLNAQMRADVRAVELRWFDDGEGRTTLSPRVIGETQAAAAAKAGAQLPRMTPADWIAERIARHGAGALTGAERFRALVEAAGGENFVPLTRGSIVAMWPTDDGKTVYPAGLYPSGLVVLRLGYLKNRPAFASEAARQDLYGRLSAVVGPLHRQHLAGEPGFQAALLNDDGVAARYAAFLREVAAEGRRA